MTQDQAAAARVRALLIQLYCDPHEWAIDRVCQKLGCCRRTIERACRRFATSPATELAYARVLRAAGALTSTTAANRTMRHIAKAAGYTDPRRLQHAINAQFGLTPSELRRGARLHRTIAATPELQKQLPDSDPKRRAYFRLRKIHREAVAERRDLIVKATPHGRDVLDGKVELLTPAQLTEQAPQLAHRRIVDLHRIKHGRRLQGAA